jgi:hypothetical protein
VKICDSDNCVARQSRRRLQAQRNKAPRDAGLFFYSDLDDFIISSSFKNSSVSSSFGLAFFGLERFGLARDLGKDITSDIDRTSLCKKPRRMLFTRN